MLPFSSVGLRFQVIRHGHQDGRYVRLIKARDASVAGSSRPEVHGARIVEGCVIHNSFTQTAWRRFTNSYDDVAGPRFVPALRRGMLAPPFDLAVALACRLETFRAHLIELKCCRGTQQLPVRLVLAAHPRRGGRTLADFLIRLPCQASGARPASAVLIDSAAEQAVAKAGYGAPVGWRLELIGGG